MRKKRKRKWLPIAGLVFFLVFLSLGGYVYHLYSTVSDTAQIMHEPIVRERPQRLITFEKAEPFSALLLGVDERVDDVGRSDTMIALAINPEKQSVKMLSIPRDTRTEIVGHGTVDKINHAYAFGGVDMSIHTVEKFLDIPIDYYIKVNMEGFQELVDAVGGISVDNEMEFTAGKYTFEKGPLNLDGEKALAFVRMRKDDPNGDFGRQNRQRQVIKGVIEKGLSLGSITKMNSIVKALGNNVKTNVTLTEMMELRGNYQYVANNIDPMSIEGDGLFIGDIWYLQVSDEEKERVQQEFKEHLDLSKPEEEEEA